MMKSNGSRQEGRAEMKSSAADVETSGLRRAGRRSREADKESKVFVRRRKVNITASSRTLRFDVTSSSRRRRDR